MTGRLVSRTCGVLVFAALALLIAGCSGVEMKGTPFYTGEYKGREGPPEDRVNVWPLLYYHDPALSVIWPVFELTDEHLAVRPVFSVYGLDEKEQVYNVLWPIGQFDFQKHDYRVFPFFWGTYRWDDGSGKDKPYCVGFPLYWHFNDPYFGKSGLDTLFPLWIFDRSDKNFTLYLPWPFVHVMREPREAGWHVWPLVGDYWKRGDNTQDYHRYQLWPLVWQWRAGAESGHCAVPLYFWRKNGDTSLFLSLPWSSSRIERGGSAATSWQLAPPFFYHSRDDEKSQLLSLLWSHGASADGSASWHTTIPLYFYNRDKSGSRFLSLPWSSASRADGSSWQLVPPLFYHNRSKDGENFFTPLWAQGRSDATKSRWHTVIPLYFLRRSPDGSLFVTLLGGREVDAAGHRWLIYPLLSWGKTTPTGGEVWAAAPLIHAKWDEQAASHHVLPFYYWDGHDGTFLSLVASRWTADDGRKTTLALPALSWLTAGEKRSDLWLAAALAHLSWGKERGPEHILPLYYRNPQTGTFVSPLVAHWTEDNASRRMFPLLLSLYSRTGDEKNLWSLLGLFRQKWGGNAPREGHLFPAYAYEGDKFFYTPLFGWNNEKDGFVYPLTPLAGMRKGEDSGGWLWPLFSYKHRPAFDHTLTNFLLWGYYERTGERSESQFFPFYRYQKYRPIGTEPPPGVASAQYGTEFHTIFGWRVNESQVRKQTDGTIRTKYIQKSGLFPLWSASKQERPGENRLRQKASILLFLYDYRHRIQPVDKKPAERDDYTRSRVLWRVWHYEKSNGDVSVDVFPAITYDRKTDGFKKVSFLWRLFRYERHPGRGTDLDLLFIPLSRAKADEKRAGT